MPTIVHFEIPADDIERAKNFYTELFGWKIEKLLGMDTGNSSSSSDMEYWMITTTDEKGNKALGGGMMKRKMPQQPNINYIGVESVDAYASKVEKIGGKVVLSKMAVPGMGYFAVCLDTENNAFAIWESSGSAK
jgi:uncharacterized protein